MGATRGQCAVRRLGSTMVTVLPSPVTDRRNQSVIAVSIVVHTALGLAIYATARGAPLDVTPDQSRVHLIYAAPKPPPEPLRRRDTRPIESGRLAPPAPPRVPVITVDIPPSLPPMSVSLGDPTTTSRANGFDPSRPADTGGAGRSGVGETVGREPYTDATVDKVAAAVPGAPAPHYPEMLRAAGVEGAVHTEFVVDSTGRADLRTFRAFDQPPDAFVSAIRTALARTRYYPAEARSRRVAQLVHQTFVFTITR
jgi:protein TonB